MFLRNGSPLWMTLLMLCQSCGAPDASQKKYQLPSEIFNKHAETMLAWRQCEHLPGYGCATLVTTGSLAQGRFTFKDIFAKCETTESGSVVRILNSTASNPSFQLEITITHPTLGAVKCQQKGGEFCDIAFQVHAQQGYSTEKTPCVLALKKLNPLEGEFACSQIVAPRGTLGIDSGSNFTCAF